MIGSLSRWGHKHGHVGVGTVAALAAIVAFIVAAIALPTSALAADTKDYTYSADPSKHKWVQLDQNTYTMDTDGNGTPDVTLVKNGDVWTYTFDVEDANREYYVYEQMSDELEAKGYTSSGSDGTAALPNDPGKTTTKTYTITNSKPHTPHDPTDGGAEGEQDGHEHDRSGRARAQVRVHHHPHRP